MVAKASPPMIVTAMDTKNTSERSGIIPSTVVSAVIATGRKRLTHPSRMASNRSFPLRIWLSISSINTMPFLICMPTRLRAPRMAMKPKGCRVASREAVMPIMPSGTVMKMLAGWRSALKRRITMSIMRPPSRWLLARDPRGEGPRHDRGKGSGERHPRNGHKPTA